MKNKIGCDIDGCLNLFHKNLINIASYHYGLHIKNDELVDVSIIESLGYITTDEKKRFFEIHHEDTRNPIIFLGAKETLDKLKSEDFEIYLITARTYDIGTMTEEWLSMHEFKYDQLLLNSGNKIDACNWKQVDLMIEDNPKNIEVLLTGGFKVIMPEHGYNKHLQHENLIHCKDWNEIYNEIKNNTKKG